jgi:uncharacterized Zn ribbon protein
MEYSSSNSRWQVDASSWSWYVCSECTACWRNRSERIADEMEEWHFDGFGQGIRQGFDLQLKFTSW